MANKNKEKGKYLEEYVATKFKKEFNLDTRDVHRAQASGVFTTEYGDIYFRKHAVIIECKNQQDVQTQRLFPELSKTIFNFYKQLEKDVQKFKNKYPDQKVLYFLVATNTSNRLPRYVIVDKQSFKEFIQNDIIDKKLLDSNISYISTKYINKIFLVFILDDFIKYINLEILEY